VRCYIAWKILKSYEFMIFCRVNVIMGFQNDSDLRLTCWTYARRLDKGVIQLQLHIVTEMELKSEYEVVVR